MKKLLATCLATALLLMWAPPLHANPDFALTTKFTLSSKKIKANPQVDVVVSQPGGQESVAKVEFDIPAGFKLPGDAAIQDGEELGSGDIAVAFTFTNCMVQGMFNATITEQDRSQDEISQGVKAKWIVDLQFIQIPLLIYGSAAAGWQIKGDVPQNDATCPPFTVHVTINQTSSDSHKPIWRNPKTPGRYTLTAIYTSTSGATSTNTQTVRIRS